MTAHLGTAHLRRGLLVLAAAGLILGLSACGGDDSSTADSSGGGDTTEETTGGDGSEGGTEVSIADFAFEPGDLTVPAGSTVTWTNEDSAPHAIQDDSDLGAEEGPEMAQGDTFELTYDEAGEYPYICGIHNYMTGTITVA